MNGPWRCGAPVRAGTRRLRRPPRHPPPPRRPAPLRRDRRASPSRLRGPCRAPWPPWPTSPRSARSFPGRAGLDRRRRTRSHGTAQGRRPACCHPPASGDATGSRDPGGRRPGQHRVAAGPVGQPQQGGGCGGGGGGPGGGAGRLPGRPGHPGPAGRRRPGQHAVAAGPVGQPQQAGGCGGGGGGSGRGAGRLPGQPGHPVRLAAADPANASGSATWLMSKPRSANYRMAMPKVESRASQMPAGSVTGGG